jgi:hypothetical protein
MAEKHHRAIVLTDFWAKVLSGLLVSCIIGGGGYAWNANAANARLQEKVESLEQAKLPSRLDKLEVKVDDTKRSIDEMKQNQGAFQMEMRQKMDLLIKDSTRRNDR